MRFNSLLRPAAAALLLGTLSPARAQDGVSMKLDLVSWGDDIPGLTLKSAGKGTPVTAKAFTYTKPVSYSGPALLEIHQEAAANPKAAQAGAQNPAPIAPELQALREKDPTIVALAKLPIADPTTHTLALFCFSVSARDEVDTVTDAALAAGGSEADGTEDHGFMYTRSFFDLDGHPSQVMWMDPAAVQ